MNARRVMREISAGRLPEVRPQKKLPRASACLPCVSNSAPTKAFQQGWVSREHPSSHLQGFPIITPPVSKLETQRRSRCKKWRNYLDQPNPSLLPQQSASSLAAQCVQKWCKQLTKETSLESLWCHNAQPTTLILKDHPTSWHKDTLTCKATGQPHPACQAARIPEAEWALEVALGPNPSRSYSE